MYGPGAPPPTRSMGTVITLRVLIAAAGFLSCGLMACLPLFRVAFLRGRWFNWAAAWVSLPLSIVCFAVVGTVEENNVKGDIALGTVLVLGALASTYFLVMDIRTDNRQYRYAGYAPAGAAAMAPGYGYPPPSVSPYANMQTGPQQPPMPHTPIPQPQPHTPAPRPPVAQGPVPPPPQQRPAPARIDQVRAELDELSDYLRKHDSNGNGNSSGSGNHNNSPEGGR
ncbi:hypothetical protein [Streptomyces sp. NBC_01451]|uniref:hypothetical protein n=1 Tax=Streptomyces sp. NBC_01451 TaxID=2903872 RepID=UPI002E3087F7|nr:hypothetical protein [Streptomyces sp. NBC_01451]